MVYSEKGSQAHRYPRLSNNSLEKSKIKECGGLKGPAGRGLVLPDQCLGPRLGPLSLLNGNGKQGLAGHSEKATIPAQRQGLLAEQGLVMSEKGALAARCPACILRARGTARAPRPRAHRSLGGAGARSPCPVQAGPRPPKGHACSADGRTLPRSSSSLCRSSAERNFEVLCTPVPGRSLRSRRLESQAEEGSRGTARGPAGHHLPL